MATHSHLQKDPGVIQPSQGLPGGAPFPAHNGRELEDPTAPWLMMSPTPGSMALPGKQQASWGCNAVHPAGAAAAAAAGKLCAAWQAAGTTVGL